MFVRSSRRWLFLPVPATALAAICCGLWISCSPPRLEQYVDLVEAFAGAVVETTDGQHVEEILADQTTGRLFLPAGSSVSWAFFAEPRSTFVVDRMSIRGDVKVVMTVETDGLSSQSRGLTRDTRRATLEIEEGDAVRLTLRVGSGQNAGDGVLFGNPAVYGVVEQSDHAALATPSRVTKPNVVIYLVDTLRRDRLGIYGYDRPTSPGIDSFASEATLFLNSHAQSTWTKPSVASLFTGVWPPSHGATGWRHRVPEEFETLAERLQATGYAIAGFVTNVNASTNFGAAQGFETSWFKHKARATEVNEKAFRWLDERDPLRPFFLYLHTMEPHAGYNPTEPFRTRFAPNADEMPSWKPRWRWPVENVPFFKDLYDGEIAQNDDAFGALLARLRELNLYDDTLLIFLSDHGEEFREHNGWRHGRVLHAETLDVPMIVKFPGQRQGQVSDIPVAHIDVLPTVLDVVGLPPAPEVEGQSLVAPTARPIFSHLRLGKAPLQYSVIFGGWKLIRIHRQEIETQLFDIGNDPGETENLAAELPIRAAALTALLDHHLNTAKRTQAEERELSRDTEQQLRALGYLQ